MVDFKQFQREAELAGTEHPVRPHDCDWAVVDTRTTHVVVHGVEQPDVLEKLTKFERGLGSLLKNAWRHVEALQVPPRAAPAHGGPTD